MVEVKVLVEHGNGFGEQYGKKKGDTYELPEAQAETLAKQGLVQLRKKAGK